MKGLRVFLNESYQELRYKVSWPTWQELFASTQLVLIAFVIISLIIFAMDFASSELLNLFYGQFLTNCSLAILCKFNCGLFYDS